MLGNDLVTMALYVIAAISGWVGPLITPKIGHRGISIAGFGIVLVSLLVAAWALYTGHTMVLPFAAAAMLWGHYWDASNCMTIPTVVARPEYRGTASGFAYMFVKLPSFLAIFLFPVLFAAVGQANATLMVAIFPLIGIACRDLHPAGDLRLRARLRTRCARLARAGHVETRGQMIIVFERELCARRERRKPHDGKRGGELQNRVS